VKARLTAGIAGAFFGVGLGVSGMVKPAKVLGFLDITGAWDPSLAFVMVGAIGVHLALARFILRRERPLLDDRFHLPATTRVDARLVAGAAVFGIGWGLGGFCPGPALVTAAGGSTAACVFVAAMALGMVLHHVTHARAAAKPREQPAASGE
jgi:uncharacterized membrane protein YedE/YeeE